MDEIKIKRIYVIREKTIKKKGNETVLKQCENNIISYLILLQYFSFGRGYILKVS